MLIYIIGVSEFVIVSAVVTFLLRLEHRLTRVETKLDMISPILPGGK